MQYLIKIKEGDKTFWVLAPEPKPAPKLFSKRKRHNEPTDDEFVVINPLDSTETSPSKVHMIVRRKNILRIVNPRVSRFDIDLDDDDIKEIEQEMKGAKAYIDPNNNVIISLPSQQTPKK